MDRLVLLVILVMITLLSCGKSEYFAHETSGLSKKEFDKQVEAVKGSNTQSYEVIDSVAYDIYYTRSYLYQKEVLTIISPNFCCQDIYSSKPQLKSQRPAWEIYLLYFYMIFCGFVAYKDEILDDGIQALNRLRLRIVLGIVLVIVLGQWIVLGPKFVLGLGIVLGLVLLLEFWFFLRFVFVFVFVLLFLFLIELGLGNIAIISILIYFISYFITMMVYRNKLIKN